MARIKDAQWNIIIAAVWHFSKAGQKPINSAAIVFDNKINGTGSKINAYANLIKSDSD